MDTQAKHPMTAALLASTLACAGTAAPKAPTHPEKTVKIQQIESWRASLERPAHALLGQLGVSSAETGVSYGATDNLSLAEAPAPGVESFYIQGDSVVLVYISGDAAEAFSPEALAAAYPPNEESLRSRVGKTFLHHVSPELGIAWADDGDEVALIELFAPCSLDDYKAHWYTDPGTFRK